MIRFLSRLDIVLGALVSRAAGLVCAVFAIAMGRACASGFTQGEWVLGVALLAVTIGCAAAAWALFRPGRRLSDMEP